MGIQTSYALDTPFPTVDTSALDSDAGAFGGIVINESWAQLEPSQGDENWSALDKSLAAVRQWNGAHLSTPLGVKLRIFGGNTAPTWAKELGGSPITITTKGIPKVFGRWWTAPYHQAWSTFQHAMATRYDSDALIRAVSVSSCATLTGEPFVINMTKPALQTMELAGWSVQAQKNCLEEALSDYSGWKHTQITFAFNPFRTLVNGRPAPDQSVTQLVMQACNQSERHDGPYCVLGNNGLSATAPTGRSAAIYSEIDALWQKNPDKEGAYFQTVSASVDCAAIEVAISHHARAVELWPPNHHYQGFAAVPISTLQQWNRALTTGTTLSCQ